MSDSKGPCYRLVSGTFLVGPKDFKDSGKSFSEAVKAPERAPDHIETIKTDEDAPLLYRLSGDYNPLHVDADLAQMSGFKKPILHGLNSFGISCHAVIKSMLDNDQTKFKAIRGRFASPVTPGVSCHYVM
jgi:acyl dehydratase